MGSKLEPTKSSEPAVAEPLKTEQKGPKLFTNSKQDKKTAFEMQLTKEEIEQRDKAMQEAIEKKNKEREEWKQ